MLSLHCNLLKIKFQLLVNLFVLMGKMSIKL